MSLKSHFILLLNVTIGWLIFVIAGLPNYYLAWTFTNLLYFSIAVYFMVGLAIYYFIRNRKHNNRFSRALWIAFYITVPLLVYDLFYIHFVLREPIDFLNRFWFLSIFYIIPWIQAPIIYWLKNNKISAKSWGLIGIACFIAAGLLWRWWAAFEGGFFDNTADYRENSTLLGSAFKYSIYGTFLLLGFLSVIRFLNVRLTRV